MSLKIKLKPCRFLFKAGFPGFAIFQDKLEARKLLKAFFLQPKLLLTKYVSEHFFLFAVGKYLKAL